MKSVAKLIAICAMCLAPFASLILLIGHEFLCGFDDPCDRCLLTDNSKNWLPGQCAQVTEQRRVWKEQHANESVR